MQGKDGRTDGCTSRDDRHQRFASCFLEMLGGPAQFWTLPQNQNISLKTTKKGALAFKLF